MVITANQSALLVNVFFLSWSGCCGSKGDPGWIPKGSLGFHGISLGDVWASQGDHQGIHNAARECTCSSPGGGLLQPKECTCKSPGGGAMQPKECACNSPNLRLAAASVKVSQGSPWDPGGPLWIPRSLRETWGPLGNPRGCPRDPRGPLNLPLWDCYIYIYIYIRGSASMTK